MKLGKKLLALALAALLALSVLTACAGDAISGTKLAKAAEGHMWYGGIAVKYDATLNKTAENAMDAVKNAVAEDATGNITRDNAIRYGRGTLLSYNGFTEAGQKWLKPALKFDSGKWVDVALVNAKGVKDEIAVIGAMAANQAVTAQDGREPDYFRMGYYQDGNYVLVVFVGEGEAPATTVAPTAA